MARAVQPARQHAEGPRLTGGADLAWRIEEACFLGWPALEQVRVGDWIARYGGGLTRRTNSANPAAPDAANPAPRLDEIETLYRRWRLPPRFRLPSFLDGRIDAALDGAGYLAEAETLTLVAVLEDLAATADEGVELAPRPSAEWLESKARLSEFSEEHADAYRRAVRGLAAPAAFAALRADEMMAAVAYGALHGRLLCLESVVTDVRYRGQGLGLRVLRGLFHWAGLQGAHAVCLQVQADNAPALALYRRLGFTLELYRYHYRTKAGA